MRVVVEIELPYSQLRRIEFASKEEAAKWLIANPNEYDSDLGNVDMFYLPEQINVYEIVAAMAAA